MPGHIDTFLAQNAQYLFLTEDGILLLGYVDQTVFTDIKRTGVNFPHHLPAGLV